jgi:hypothetical protein
LVTQSNPALKIKQEATPISPADSDDHNLSPSMVKFSPGKQLSSVVSRGSMENQVTDPDVKVNLGEVSKPLPSFGELKPSETKTLPQLSKGIGAPNLEPLYRPGGSLTSPLPSSKVPLSQDLKPVADQRNSSVKSETQSILEEMDQAENRNPSKRSLDPQSLCYNEVSPIMASKDNENQKVKEPVTHKEMKNSRQVESLANIQSLQDSGKKPVLDKSHFESVRPQKSKETLQQRISSQNLSALKMPLRKEGELQFIEADPQIKEVRRKGFENTKIEVNSPTNTLRDYPEGVSQEVLTPNQKLKRSPISASKRFTSREPDAKKLRNMLHVKTIAAPVSSSVDPMNKDSKLQPNEKAAAFLKLTEGIDNDNKSNSSMQNDPLIPKDVSYIPILRAKAPLRENSSIMLDDPYELQMKETYRDSFSVGNQTLTFRGVGDNGNRFHNPQTISAIPENKARYSQSQYSNGQSLKFLDIEEISDD